MDRKEFIYYSFMKKVVSDGFISLDESGLIMILEERLGLSDDVLDDIMGMIEDNEGPSKEELECLSKDDTLHMEEKDIYEHVLKEAFKDEDINEEELSALEELGRIMCITKEERQEIYHNVRGHPGLLEIMRKTLNADQ